MDANGEALGFTHFGRGEGSDGEQEKRGEEDEVRQAAGENRGREEFEERDHFHLDWLTCDMSSTWRPESISSMEGLERTLELTLKVGEEHELPFKSDVQVRNVTLKPILSLEAEQCLPERLKDLQ